MAQLTKFEALQLAAVLIGQSDTPTVKVKKLFEVADEIMRTDKQRMKTSNPPKNTD